MKNQRSGRVRDVPTSVSRDELLALLHAGERVLLPNHRAARALRREYDDQQRAKGLDAWQPAAAVAWSQWTNALYKELIVSGVETRLLMNAAQEHSLWQQVIEDDPPEGSLDSTDSLAELAASGMRLAGSWNAVGRLRQAANSAMGNADTRTFARWVEEFQRRCATQKLLSAALLEEALTRQVAARSIAAPAGLRLVAFSRWTPSQRSLLDALRDAGTRIVEQALASDGKAGLRGVVALEGPAEELEFATRWLRQTLERAQAREQRMSVAVLVPGLGDERAELEAALRSRLAPELHDVETDLSSTPWEFSVGVPLSSLGMITDVLDLVRWVSGPLSLTRISSLLLSPYVGSAAGREQAAQLDARLRRKESPLRPELTLHGLIAALDKNGSSLAWPRNLATEIARSGDLSRPRSYADWMEAVRVLIQSTGWPNSEARELTAMEFEVTQAWDKVLDTVATLDFSGRRVAFEKAVEALERQVGETPFLPPGGHADVRVMTPQEAEGSLFDAVLFLRATDENWPAMERTHPLLPWQLQKELTMPGTDFVQAAARALEFTRSLTASAETVLFTRAQSDANGHLRASPMLAAMRLVELQAEDLVAASQPAEIRSYDNVRDDTPLTPLRTNEFHGGATLLKLQAACGFLAYAQLRLNAGPLESSDMGLDARESGTLVHKVLHRFWQTVRDQETLASYSDEERREMLALCIDQTFAAENRRLASAWDAAYVQLLQERLLRLLMQWLDCELDRSPFEVIGTEQSGVVSVGPLELRVQMDRVDNILDADGNRVGEVYIDYKTGGAASPAQWKSERPDEPQLPLYALQSERDEVLGVAFAKLRAGDEMKYAGIQAVPGVLGSRSPKPANLAAQIDEWKAALTQLAEDFASGRSAVSPKQYPKTCTHCEFRLLCRVDPALLREAEEDEDAEESDV